MHRSLLPTAPAGLLLALAAALPAQTTAVADVATRFHAQVEAIAAGETIGARRAAIIDRLDALELAYRLEPFTGPPWSNREGANILVELGAADDGPVILLGAHYDRVPVGQGAVDNASGSAAVLELLEAFRSDPPPGARVLAAFFDLEEAGLFGSRAYVAARDAEALPAVYINFDVFGYGDALWLMAPDTLLPLAVALRDAAAAAGHAIVTGPDYPSSDHVSFLPTAVETYSLSLLEHDEVHAMLAMLRGAPDPRGPPRVMRIIHTAGDTPEQIEAEDVARALAVVETAIRRMAAAR